MSFPNYFYAKFIQDRQGRAGKLLFPGSPPETGLNRINAVRFAGERAEYKAEENVAR